MFTSGLLVLVTTVSAQPNPFPGSIALAYGYNVLKGSPLGGGADPGWGSQPVFDPNCATCFAGGSTIDGFDLPAGISAVPASFCSYNSSTFSIHDGVDLQSASSTLISTDDAFSGLFVRERFSSSEYSSQVSTLTANGAAAVVISTARCDVFDVALDAAHYNFVLTPNFVRGLEALPPLSADPATLAAYASFIDVFGTHVPDALTLGGLASQISTFTGANFSVTQEAVDSLDAAASFSLLIFFGVDVSSGSTRSLADYLAFAGAQSSNKTECRPACPPVSSSAAVDPGQWAPFLSFGGEPGATPPAPTVVRLIPLSAALTQHALPRALARGEISLARFASMERAAADIESFLNTSYCSLTPRCASPSPVPAITQAPVGTLPSSVGLTGAAMGTLAFDGGARALLLVGGSTSCAAAPIPTSDVWIADLNAPSGGWTKKGELPTNGSAFAASVVISTTPNPLFVIAGGFTLTAPPGSPGAAPVLSSAVAYADVTTGTWTTGAAPLLSPRAMSASALFGGVLVILGGTNGTSALASIECVGVAPGAGAVPCPSSVPAALPSPLVGASALALDASPFTAGAAALFLIGGCAVGGAWGGVSCPHGSTLSAVWLLESSGPFAGEWQAMPPLPAPRYGTLLLAQPASAASGAGGLWAIGGADDTGTAMATISRFDYARAAWQILPWTDPWPTAFGAAADGPLRAGGCSTLAGVPRTGIVSITGGLDARQGS